MIGIIALVLVMGVVYASNRKRSAKTVAIQTKIVQTVNFRNVISSSGKTAADRAVNLKFQTSGKLAWVKVKEGDSVSAYQAIAGMDVREVQKSLEKALRDYSSERNDFEETWRVTYGSKKPEQALTDTVKRVLEKNQWDLEKAVLDVELKHLAVEYATLVSPIDGIVTHIDTPIAGVNVTPAGAVFSVADPTSVIFEANVDELDVGDLTIGQEAQILLDAYPAASYSGTISFISYTSEQSSGGATVFPVKITFRNPPENLRFGLNGDINIITRQMDNVLTAPLEAIRDDQKGEYVYTKKEGKFKKVPVETSFRSEEEVVIASGLKEGDVVVTKGFLSIPK